MDTTFLTVREVAARWRVSVTTVHRVIDDGHLTTVRVGRAIRIEEAEADRYIAANTKLATV